MFTADITLNTKSYVMKAQRATSSVRGVATRPVSEPLSLTISHETAKNGRVSSVIMIDDTAVVQSGTSVAHAETLRAMLKIQYNPLSGRTSIDAAVQALCADIVAFATPANITKLLNKES